MNDRSVANERRGCYAKGMFSALDVGLVGVVLAVTVGYLGWVLFGERVRRSARTQSPNTAGGAVDDDCCGPS